MDYNRFMNMSLKTIWKSKNLKQKQAANILAVSLRSYKDYENNLSKVDTIKIITLLILLENTIRLMKLMVF